MGLEEEPVSAAPEMQRAIDWLRDCADLAGVDPVSLESLAAAAVYFSLPAGHLLFEAGSNPDGVYLLASGRLGVKTHLKAGLTAEIERGELVGEAGWLLGTQRSATVVALRDSELLLIPNSELDRIAAESTHFSLALARLCARRLRHSNRQEYRPKRAHIFVLVPNSIEVDIVDLATRLVDELGRSGRTELVWDARATTHTASWFNGIEESNDYVVYVANWAASGWTRQCCRQADVILMAAPAAGRVNPWPAGIADAARARGARVELALLHQGSIEVGCAAVWLKTLPATLHHHLLEPSDYSRLARLLMRRGVGLVLSGGGARGFAHLGIIRALREAKVPIDFVGGASIGAIIAAGVAMGWSDEEMRLRYRRSFVDTNPVNDYTFPFLALTRGKKVSRLLEREYGSALIEDLRHPYFCVSANLTTGRLLEHRAGLLSYALRASVAIPGVMPPVFHDDGVLVDGAAINNLPVDVMQSHAPGFVIGSDVGADRNFGERRVNIFQVLMHAGMVNSTASERTQRELADVLLKPPLVNIDLLNWQAFDGAIQAGYDYARMALDELPALPRVLSPLAAAVRPNSAAAELERRIAATIAAG
ncbi:MAG TPA: patatin-like phospholipase family protein [Steroidobacteraceae bacterium]|nr:patatin-like phospholipase family protein [Steroidobacteraceae bacterium]